MVTAGARDVAVAAQNFVEEQQLAQCRFGGISLNEITVRHRIERIGGRSVETTLRASSWHWYAMEPEGGRKQSSSPSPEAASSALPIYSSAEYAASGEGKLDLCEYSINT